MIQLLYSFQSICDDLTGAVVRRWRETWLAIGVAAPLNSLATGVGTTPALPATPVVTQASVQTPAPFRPSNHFLQVNGAYNPPAAAQPQAPLNDVDQAAEDLEAALDQQRSVDPFARRFLQGQVNAARDELDGAIRDEIDATQTRAPYFVPVTLDDKRQTGAGIEERHAENDAISLEVDRAVGRVIVDVEVDDTVDLVTRAPNADRGYGLLAGRLDDVSDKARLRLLCGDLCPEYPGFDGSRRTCGPCGSGCAAGATRTRSGG